MKVAVSGGTGFIGSYVLSELANRHIDHTVLTRKPAFVHSTYSKTLVHDINSDSKDIYNMLGRPDVLVHLVVCLLTTGLSTILRLNFHGNICFSSK